MRIARVTLLNPRGLQLETRDRDRLQVARRVQVRRKREMHLVPWGEIACRIACGGELAAFEVAKMANVMRRPILPCAREWGFARGRQHAVFGKHDVKRHRAAVLRFPPHAEMAREPLAQLVPRVLVGGDGQADGSGRVWIGRRADLAAIALA